MKSVYKLINSHQAKQAGDLLKDNLYAIKQSVGREGKKYLISKLTTANSFYTRTTGIDLLDKYQSRVVELQDQLAKAQEARRDIGRELSDIRSQYISLQEQLRQVKRHENPKEYLSLVENEIELLGKERRSKNKLEEHDKDERAIFTLFTNAIRESYEKQQIRLEYTKYIGIIISLVGSLITYMITKANKSTYRKIIAEDVGDKYTELISLINEQESALKQIKSQQNNVETSFKHLSQSVKESVKSLTGYSTPANDQSTPAESNNTYYNRAKIAAIAIGSVAFMLFKVIGL